ncbi:MAG: PAS domain-containing sensor histidine kinase, partial [Halobacteriales archaeon]|nr:PAS domain-containing sensor histidine kinase [Halobacteriales archaeon]
GRTFERYSKPQWLGRQVVGRVWSFRDVTARLRVEAELRESQERMRLLIDGTKDHAILFLGPDGRIGSWNPGAERIKGYTAAEIVGKPYSTFFTPEDVAAGKPQVALRTAETTGRYEEEGQRVRKDGTRFWADVVLTALRDGQGRLRGYSKITRDITERKKAEAQRAEMERLSELHRFKEGFLRNAAHELGTPLTPLKLQVRVLHDLLAQRPGSREARSVEILDRNIERLHALVRDMLEAARLQSGRMALKPRPMDLAHAVHDVVDTFQEAAIHSGIRLDVAGPSSVTLDADPDRIGQVLYNLVSNAMKFTLPGGKVHVEVGRRGGMAQVTVRDNGCGLAPEQVARLFHPFVQVHDTNERNPGGSGLGLYISKGIVESHGGALTVASGGPGQGCAFTFTVPVAPVRVPMAPVESPATH